MTWDGTGDPRDGWPETLRELQEGGVELPSGLAILDLRWWQREIVAGAVAALPGARELAERWGWRSSGRPSVRRVRNLLGDVERWSDPELLDAWRRRRSDP